VTGEQGEELRHSVVDRVRDLLDSWAQAVDEYQQTGTKIRYQQYERPREGGHLLREMLDSKVRSVHEQKFRVNRSLRDVEPSVDLYVVEAEAG